MSRRDEKLYTESWRRRVRSGAKASASVLAPLLCERFAPSSLVDVGCGEGWLTEAFAEHGVERTLGVDGPWVTEATTVDLTKPPYPKLERFDLAVCLEVAEHVPAQHADRLVKWLVSLAPTVVFSAAIPGQGGAGHVNEQWPGYWVKKFARYGFAASGALRSQLWADERVEPWYRQNLLVFGDLRGLPEDGCPPIVHPGIWKVYRP